MLCSLGHFDFTNCLDPYRLIIEPPELCFMNVYLSLDTIDLVDLN